MGRPKINVDQIPARFPAGTFDRIDSVLEGGETRTDLIRHAVEVEIKLRARKAKNAGGRKDE